MAEHIDKTNHKYRQYKRPYPRWAVDAMEEVLKLEGPKRWRTSAAIYLNLNPVTESGMTAKEEYNHVVAQLREKRLNLKTRFGEINTHKAGTVGNSGLRESLEIPAGLWAFIKQFDMPSFAAGNPDAKKNLQRLHKEFKEFSVAEVM